jgi:uncharacterized protein
MRQIEEVVMALDEFEAMRLADLDGLYQEQAAEQMKVSRPTFSRIIDAAHRKMADALVHGKALRIEGGPVEMEGRRCCKLHDGENGSRVTPVAATPGRINKTTTKDKKP